jgi:tetratricopeptide (TPR) repeat protein
MPVFLILRAAAVGGQWRRCCAALAIVWLAAATGCQWAAVGQNADGVRMFQQGYYQGALDRFQRAVQSDPNNPDGYYNLAATYHRTAKLHGQEADYQRAESFYRQCLDRAADQHAECYRGLAVLLVERGRREEAFQLLRGWAGRQPAQTAPQIELARLFEESGDPDSAKQHLIDALAIDPNDARALTALGQLREQSGETRQALANYQRSLAINRFQPQVAARVASLQAAAAPAPTPPGGTRTVNTPSALPVR